MWELALELVGDWAVTIGIAKGANDQTVRQTAYCNRLMD
jgi:hypothetical protein